MEWLTALVYLLAPAAFSVLGAPIAALLFRSLPRKGAAFALPTALVPFTIAVFWLGQFTFGHHTLLFGVFVLVVGALAADRLGADPEWRSVAAMYGVFAVGFFVMVAFRAANPGITPAGGEQFLHFGLVNALERATELPPRDMWFAGERLKYYYGTQLQVASLSMLTGTPMRYGFNLGIATFYGLLFVVAYGVGGAVANRRDRSYRLGGVLTAFFVALAGPATTAIRLATPYLPEALDAPVERAAFGFVATRFNGGELARTVTELSDPLGWGWWYTRYVVPGTIQEVPLYSFVKADLHGHTFANGYVLFAGALALAYYASPAEARKRRLGIVFGGLGAVAGLFGFMNTWSLPTAGGLTVLAVAAADAHPATLLPEPWSQRLQLAAGTDGTTNDPLARFGDELWRLVLASVAGGLVLLIGVAVASPFLVFGQIPTNEGIGFLPPRSPLGPFLVIYAGLVSVFALYVAMRGWPALRETSNPPLVAGLALAAALIVGLVLVLENFAVVTLLGSLIVVGWLLVRSDRADFAVVLLVAGAGLLLSFEFVHARLPLVAHPRWNTSLKVAVQGWTLGAAGAGAATAILLARSRERLATLAGVGEQSTDRAGTDTEANLGPSNRASTASTGAGTALRALVPAVLVGVVLLASAVFPTMMFAAEIGSELAEDHYNPSVDGHKAAERFHANEYGALQWLDERSGHPTIVEAPGNSYHWTSPAATFSGLPSVVGWDHEAEYRSPEAYQRRVDHADAIYTGESSESARLLERYDVTYVYVGPNERERYGSELRDFDGEAFSVAYEGGDVRIYEVDHSALPS